MREIKFRALAVVNDKHAGIKVGDFVYGHYIESGCDAPCIIFGDGEQIEVNKKTLGQFISLTDENGANIFDGDIINDSLVGVGAVKFCNANSAFKVSYGDGVGKWFIDFSASDMRSLEVIGNIHQNPELLER